MKILMKKTDKIEFRVRDLPNTTHIKAEHYCVTITTTTTTTTTTEVQDRRRFPST
jgi:hypothetical protein